jgi:hypothetical protein
MRRCAAVLFLYTRPHKLTTVLQGSGSRQCICGNASKATLTPHAERNYKVVLPHTQTLDLRELANGLIALDYRVREAKAMEAFIG